MGLDLPPDEFLHECPQTLHTLRNGDFLSPMASVQASRKPGLALNAMSTRSETARE